MMRRNDSQPLLDDASSAGRDPLRVVHVVRSLEIGGVERLVCELSAARAADRTAVLCLLSIGPLGEQLARRGVDVRLIGMSDGKLPTILRMRQTLAELRPDVVHCHNWLAFTYGGLAARLRGAPGLVFTRHGAKPPTVCLGDRVNRWFARRARIVGVTAEIRDAMSRWSRRPACDVRYVPNGLDLAPYDQAPRREVARQRLGWKPDEQRIGIVARLSEEKDHVSLLQAFVAVSARHPAARLVLVGDGPLRETLRTSIRDLGLTDTVDMLGSRIDIPQLLAGLDLFVLPSRSEGIPMTLLEAMAARLPVVATAVGGIPAVVRRGETGLLVPPGEPAALAEAISVTLDDRAMANAMGEAGRRRVEEEFDLRRVSEEYEALYRSFFVSARVENSRTRRTATRPAPNMKCKGDVVHVPVESRHSLIGAPTNRPRWNMHHRLIRWYESGLRGRQTFAYAAELMESQWWSPDELSAWQFARLRSLLGHAFENCPYYRQTWQRLGLTPSRIEGLEGLVRWPILDRETVRSERQSLIAAEPCMVRYRKTTGGSTGVPLEFLVDADANERQVAASMRGYAWGGATPGTRQLYLWGATLGEPSRWRRWKEHAYDRWLYRRKMLNSFEFRDDRVREYVRRIDRFRPTTIVAYTNPIYALARAAREAGLTPYSPQAVIVGAEKLHDFQRALIEDVFAAPVFESYGAREFMLIGAECELHSGLHLTAENLLVEIVDDDGSPTAPGQEGNVVVTDLHNRAMPFIRYANGDRAVAASTPCACGRGLPRLSKVIGRRLDMLHTPDGRHVPGEFFPHLLKEFAAVRRFQVVQEAADRLELKIVVDDRWDDVANELLVREVRAVVGPAVRFDVRRVEQIPLTPSGKLQVVVRRQGVRSGESAVGHVRKTTTNSPAA